MSAFDRQFAGDGRGRIKGEIDPGIIAACSDQPAEAAVIGALLRDSKLIDDAVDRLRSDEFSDTVLATVFATMGAMHAAGHAVAPITVARRLANDTDLTERGGAKFLATLAAADTVDRGLGYVDHLVDLSRRRFLHVGLVEMRQDIGDTGMPIETTIDGIEGVLSGALFWTTSRTAVTFAEAWDATIARVEAIGAGRVERGCEIVGFHEWNEITGGMEPGQLVLLGGRPGMGKTSVAQRVARGAAEAGHGTLFISCEMPVAQLMMRLVADMLFEAGGRATFADIKRGRMDRDDYARAAAIRERIDAWPLRFEEPERINASLIGATRARGSQIKANGLVEVLSDDDTDSGELRTDGPTVTEFVAAGYPAKNYPPAGYASRSTEAEIAAAIKQQESIPMTTETGGAKVAPAPENKKAAAPRNKAAATPPATSSIPSA